ncbi:MAG: DEAD/DEAH box helicase [Vallitaleaceae bacterium]|jgi:ATP-dependent RNA helicase DeaD|nr:DEAD/DEAH box helicase [Vallitaleaceae bacterium]
MKIEALDISTPIKRAIYDMGFDEYTDIQTQAVPLLLEGKDVIGQSQTGTGKTAAFAIPILQKIDLDIRKPQALVLCPTRELAVQVAEEFRRIAKYMTAIKIVAVYGGEPINRQIIQLNKGAQIIIGTPGRTIDHITKRRTIKTNYISTFVLDEADEMLKMGFREDIEQILEAVPDDRQTVLFSATMPQPILDITKKYQLDPQLVKVTTQIMTADTITQQYCSVKSSDRMEALSRILKVFRPNRCIVFCNMKSTVDKVNDELQSRSFTSEKIHGDLNQELRMNVLSRFNNSVISILVATDVAARGLDISDVDLIVNYDMPEKEDYYVHRIGRSGRAGKEGRAITLVTGRDHWQLKNIVRYTHKHIDEIKIPTLEQVNQTKMSNFIEQIVEIIEHEELSPFLEILNQFDTVYPIDSICAALIKRDLDLEEDSKQNDINDYAGAKRGSGSSSGSRNDRSSGSKARGRGERGPKRATDKDMVRIFMTVGHKDNIKAKHIMGAITGECGVRGDQIGSIDILEKFSFADVHQDVAKKVVKKLHGQKVRDKKVAVEIAKHSK